MWFSLVVVRQRTSQIIDREACECSLAEYTARKLGLQSGKMTYIHADVRRAVELYICHTR